MGTSLLTMPWAMSTAGLGGGIVCLIAVACLSLYTSYRVIDSVRFLETRGGKKRVKGAGPILDWMLDKGQCFSYA